MYHRFDKEQIQWREEVDRNYPREKVYIFSPDNAPSIIMILKTLPITHQE
ncbi:hypothetical protein ECP030481612_4981 [Escherichia coli P0304816.12]|nr:hypothetical protein ECP030481612_4981 [Escherichia coli P0304816.12]